MQRAGLIAGGQAYLPSEVVDVDLIAQLAWKPEELERLLDTACRRHATDDAGGFGKEANGQLDKALEGWSHLPVAC